MTFFQLWKKPQTFKEKKYFFFEDWDFHKSTHTATTWWHSPIVCVIANLFLLTKNDMFVHHNKCPNLGVCHTNFPNLKGPRAPYQNCKNIPARLFWIFPGCTVFFVDFVAGWKVSEVLENLPYNRISLTGDVCLSDKVSPFDAALANFFSFSNSFLFLHGGLLVSAPNPVEWSINCDKSCSLMMHLILVFKDFFFAFSGAQIRPHSQWNLGAFFPNFEKKSQSPPPPLQFFFLNIGISIQSTHTQATWWRSPLI